jgi:hypothetical protein
LHSVDAIGAARRGKRDHLQLDGVAIGGTYGDVVEAL